MKKITLFILILISFVWWTFANNINDKWGYSYESIKDLNLMLYKKLSTLNNVQKNNILNNLKQIYSNFWIRKNTKIKIIPENNEIKVYIWGKISNSLFYATWVSFQKQLFTQFQSLPLNYFIQDKQKLLNLMKEIDNWQFKENCDNFNLYFNWLLYDIFIINWLKWLYVKLPLDKYLWCYIKKNKNKYIFKYELDTIYHKYRTINIWNWINWLTGFYDYWDTINVFEWIRKNKDKYVKWYALIYSWNKVESKLVYWWGLCWVSTIMYQTLSKIKWMKIEKVYHHMNFYYSYYWQLPWTDSTVYFSNNFEKPYKNLIIKNYFWPIYIDYFDKIAKWRWWKRDFHYWLKVYSLWLWFNFYDVKLIKKYERNWKKCYTVWFFDKKTNNLVYTRTSCYFNVLY